MSNTQSIIVYRNPAEAAFWESGLLIPLMGGLGVGLLVFLILARVLEKKINGVAGKHLLLAVSLFAIAAGVFTLNWLII